MDYKNEICPVCGEPFKNDDDIVVCPDCGTPYHRECWKKVGYCTFRDRHAEGFVWQPSVKEETPEEQAQINEHQNDGQDQQPIQPVFMKTPLKKILKIFCFRVWRQIRAMNLTA